MQRLAHRHRALEGEIEIFRRIAAEAHGPVVDQRLRMDEAVLEAEAVDERLQRRARRAQRLRHVHLAGAARVEIIGGGDARPHLAGCVVDGENGDGDLRPQRAGALARELFQRALQIGVDGQAMDAALRLGGDHLIGGVRRQHRQRLPLARHGFRLGAGDLVARHRAGVRRALEHAVARGLRALGEAIRPAQFRRLRQRHQERRLAERQLARLLAEIGERRGADAFEIAAVGRERQIKREHLRLAQMPFELERAHHLPQLRRHVAVLARLQQPRHLHGQRRAAGDDVAADRELKCGARTWLADRHRDGCESACPHRQTAI